MSMNKRKKKFWNFLSAAAAAASVCCLGFAGWHYLDSVRSEKKYEEVRQSARINAETDHTATESEKEADLAAKLKEIENAEFTGIIDAPAPEIPEEILTDAEQGMVDFAKLQELNPELYAWIRIPNTAIDYPVAQYGGEEQDFYLHHNMYGEPEFAGCIYTENVNSKDFDDPVTVMYGHNMKNGSMFQNLFYFLEE